MRPLPRRAALAAAWLLTSSAPGALAQGVSGGTIAGTVADPHGGPAAGVGVLAVHEPSGSRYAAVSRVDGRFTIPALRLGGPYSITASVASFEPAAARGVFVALGTTTEVLLSLGRLVAVEEVTVTAGASSVWSPARTGAATTVPREALASLPRARDRLDEFSRLTPQYFGGAIGGAFAGADRRLVGLTVDGSSFNTFMGGQPGDRTNVAPIPTEALEEVQVGVAPYDVRQANFVGAGVSAATRGGGNAFRGSAHY